MNTETAHSIGYRTFGPIFAAWCQLLQREVRTQRLQTLFFIARDAYLLKQVAETFALAGGEMPQLAYLQLSRRATILPACRGINTEMIGNALSWRTGTLSLGTLLEGHGITEEIYLPVLQGNGMDPLTPLTSIGQAAKLLTQDSMAQMINIEVCIQREALLDYLINRHGVGSHPCALVDIGWRGSIQNHLTALFATQSGAISPYGIYLGLWREDGAISRLPVNSIGLAGDLRRGRRWHESAPWQASLLLEAISRENTGTTLRFQMTKDGGAPSIAADSQTARHAEQASGMLAQAVRNGILEFIRIHGKAHCETDSDIPTLRYTMQRHLLRLTFFPSSSEIALGEQLVHTEGHDQQWSRPLVIADRPNPLLSPLHWLAGLASPWRAGYVRASAGPLGAALFAASEATLVAMPPKLRITVQDAARRLARPPRLNFHNS